MQWYIDTSDPESADYPEEAQFLGELRKIVLLVMNVDPANVRVICRYERAPMRVVYVLSVESKESSQDIVLISPTEIQCANEEQQGTFSEEFLEHLKINFGRLFPLWVHQTVFCMKTVQDFLMSAAKKRSATLFLYRHPELVGSL